MSKQMREDHLNKSVFNYYKNRKKAVYSEVPFMSRIIDLVILEDEEITSCELKIKNWQKAIEQMKQHRIGAAFSYLCMPDQSVSIRLVDKIKGELEFYGFGLRVWNENSETIETLLPARRSEYLCAPTARKLLQNIKVIECRK